MSDIQDLSQIFIQTLEQSIDSVVVIDDLNHVILFNRAAEHLWGYGREEVMGRNVSMLVPKSIRGDHDAYIDANRNTGVNRIVGTSRDVLIERKDGEHRWGAMSISKVCAAEQTLYTAFIKDITRQHQERERLYLLSLVVDGTENAIIITDAHWSMVYVNSGFTRMFGYSAAEAVGKTPIEVVVPDLEQDSIAALRGQLVNGEIYHSQKCGYTRDDQRVWCNVTTYPSFDDQGKLTNTVSVLIDITHSRMHEVLHHKMLEVMVQEESIETLMNLACREIERIAPDITASILRVDQQGLLHTLAAPSLPVKYCAAIDGLSISECLDSDGKAALATKPVWITDIADHPFWEKSRELILSSGLKTCWLTPIKSNGGTVLGVFAFYYKENRAPSKLHHLLVGASIHLCALALEREESRVHIHQLAFYDDLTGLPNRYMLHARGDQAIAEASRNHTSVAVLFIDLDRFKQVNDSLGHPAGDEFLRLIARRLSEQRRQTDITCRLSGDEFVMVLPHATQEQTVRIIEQLNETLTAPCLIAGVTLVPSVSIGVSMFPEDGHTMDALLQRSDMAMYQAKTNGRGCVRFFSHGLDKVARARLDLESALRIAIDLEQLHLVYQPQIMLETGDLYGMEALARWNHPTLGDISPARFIPLAQECGLINKFSRWALHEACLQLATWRRQGLTVPAVSVNLSPTNFHDRDLAKLIAKTLEQHSLRATDLTVEITESVLMDNNPDTLTTIDEVHALGIRLAMDDFGTGYSSLGYLRRIPIQELKLDRSFVNDLESDSTSQALSEAVFCIGESLHLNVVAEGIETLAQQRILQDQGYRIAQGFLISRPLPPAELGAWLESRFVSA